MPASVVLPRWIDEVPGVDFGAEKQLLEDMEAWARDNGWIVSDGSSLPRELRQRTDVLFERADKGEDVRVAVLPKSRRGVATLRVDSSTLRTVELKGARTPGVWRVWVAGIPIEDDLSARGWHWLFDLLFRE